MGDAVPAGHAGGIERRVLDGFRGVDVTDEEPAEVAPLAGEARCGADWDDPEEGPAQCPEPSRFIVARSDFDTSFGENGGSAEACERHLAGTVAGMIGGDDGIRAVVTVRWDPPAGGQEAATAARQED